MLCAATTPKTFLHSLHPSVSRSELQFAAMKPEKRLSLFRVVLPCTKTTYTNVEQERTPNQLKLNE